MAPMTFQKGATETKVLFHHSTTGDLGVYKVRLELLFGIIPKEIFQT